MKPARLFLYRLVSALVPETRGFAFKCALLRWCGATVATVERFIANLKPLAAQIASSISAVPALSRRNFETGLSH